MVSCGKLLSVRSWSGHNPPVNLYQINAILCSDQEGQGSPLSPGPTKRRQISSDSSLRARTPDPAQLSSLRQPGTQDLTGPETPQAAQTVVQGG